MTIQSFVRRIFAGTMIVIFALSAIVQARPMPQNVFVQQDEKRKLPPVNWIRSRKIDVKHLDIDLSFDWDKEQAMGSTVVTFAPFADTDTFQLDAALMTIESVTLVGGGALKYTYDGKKDNDNLEVTLDRVYRGGEDVRVKVVYKTNYVNNASDSGILGGFGQGLRFIKPTADEPSKPRQIWSQGESEFNRYWFPSYDSPNDFRTTELRATVAKPFFVVSNGKLIETKENADNTRTFYWKMDQPYTNYLTSIVVSETTPVVQDFDGIPVYNYGYVNETKEVAATVKNLPATMRFFSELTGVKYPYAKYSQAFVEDFGGGMENISATTQIEEMIHDERELLDTDSEPLQSHELAHQWFGNYVTCRDWGQIWLNESFATYLEAMWIEKLKGHEEFLYNDIRGNQNTVLGSWADGNRRPIVTKYFTNKDAMFDNYSYPGGASILHMLRKHLGDKLFAASLKKYLTDNAHQPVSTEELRIAIEEASGQSMDWFFDQWLYRMGHPVFEVTQAYDAGAKKLTLNVKQTQKLDLNNEYPQTEFFQSYVDVNIDNKVARVWMKPQAENVFTFDAVAKPKLVHWDYEGTLLKEMKFDKSTDDLLYQMANDKDLIGRRWAMNELEAKAANTAEKERIVAALITSAEKDPNWRVRRAALSVIANIYSPDPPQGQERPAAKLDANVEAAVIRLTKDKEAPIRSDAIELLGETQDKKYADIYLANLNDRSYGVIDYAAAGLGASRDPRAFDALVKLVDTPSWKGRIKAAGLLGLSWLADKRAFEVGLKAVKDTTLTPQVRSDALLVVGVTGKGEPRAFDVIAERTEQAAQAGNTNGVYDGLDALVRIADPRGQKVFDAMKIKFANKPDFLKEITALEADFKAPPKP